MRNNKGMSIICWVISVLSILVALLNLIDALNTKVIFQFTMGVVWLILGIVYWRRK